jgi:hypothetical protein
MAAHEDRGIDGEAPISAKAMYGIRWGSKFLTFQLRNTLASLLRL